VIIKDHVGDRFFGASELSGDVEQFGEVGIERLSGSGTESAEFRKSDILPTEELAVFVRSSNSFHIWTGSSIPLMYTLTALVQDP